MGCFNSRMRRRKARRYCRTSSGTWLSVSSFTMQIDTMPAFYPPNRLWLGLGP
jgi:hypothetical protein